MFFLETGAIINWDITTSHPLTVGIIVGGVFLIIGLLLFALVRYSGKLGPIDFRKLNVMGEASHALDLDIQEKDKQLQKSVFVITERMSNRLTNIFNEFGYCSMVVNTLVYVVLRPLIRSVFENHFTTVLMPDKREIYIGNLLTAIEDEYLTVFNNVQHINCNFDVKLKAWAEVAPVLKKFLLLWVDFVVTETIKSCIRKIEIYRQKEPLFHGNDRMSKVIVERIGKNNDYIKMLDRHGKGLLGDDLGEVLY